MRIYLLLAMAAGASLIGSSCGGGGVGDPCVPEDEYLTTFSGFSVGEVNVESRSVQCLTRVCLVNHFQGRVSCPYGQEEDTYEGDPRGPIEGSGRAACAGINTVPPGSPPDFQCVGGPDGGNDGSLCEDATCSPGGAQHEKSCRVPDRDGSRIEDRIQVPVDPQFTERSANDTVYCSCRCAGNDAAARYCQCPSGFSCEALIDDLGLGKGQLAGSYCIKDGTKYDPSDPPKDDCLAAEGKCGSTVLRYNPTAGSLTKVGRNDGVTCEAPGTACLEDIYCCDAPQGGSDSSREPYTVGRKRCSEVGDGPVSAVNPDTGDQISFNYCPFH